MEAIQVLSKNGDGTVLDRVQAKPGQATGFVVSGIQDRHRFDPAVTRIETVSLRPGNQNVIAAWEKGTVGSFNGPTITWIRVV